MPRDTQAVSPESGLSHRVGAVERGSLPALQTQMPLGQEGALVAVRVCPLACCAVLVSLFTHSPLSAAYVTMCCRALWSFRVDEVLKRNIDYFCACPKSSLIAPWVSRYLNGLNS